MKINNNDKQELFEMLLYDLQQHEKYLHELYQDAKHLYGLQENAKHLYECEIIVEQEELKGILETIDIIVKWSLSERKKFLRNLSKEYENKINYILNKKVKLGKVTNLERDLLHLLMEDYIITRFEPQND